MAYAAPDLDSWGAFMLEVYQELPVSLSSELVSLLHGREKGLLGKAPMSPPLPA